MKFSVADGSGENAIPISLKIGMFLQAKANPNVVYLVVANLVSGFGFLRLGSLALYSSMGVEVTTANYRVLKQSGELMLEVVE